MVELNPSLVESSTHSVDWSLTVADSSANLVVSSSKLMESASTLVGSSPSGQITFKFGRLGCAGPARYSAVSTKSLLCFPVILLRGLSVGLLLFHVCLRRFSRQGSWTNHGKPEVPTTHVVWGPTCVICRPPNVQRAPGGKCLQISRKQLCTVSWVIWHLTKTWMFGNLAIPHSA